MLVAGEIAARAAPLPEAVVKAEEAAGPADEAIMREFCTVSVAELTNFTL